MSPPGLAHAPVIVTGAAGGIGRHVVAQLAAAGAHVLAVDRGGVEEATTPAGGEVHAHHGDVTDGAAVAAMVEAAVDRWGAVRALVNVVGGSGRAYGDGPVDRCTDAGWDWVMDTHLRSVFLCCRAVLPIMTAGGGGAIVNFSSVLGMVAGGQPFATHAYAAAKAGVIGLTRAMAVHYAPQGVRANVVAPGLVATPMSERALSDPGVMAHVARMQPLIGGAGSPAAAAAAAVFLVSDNSAMITGAVVPVDGGWTAQ